MEDIREKIISKVPKYDQKFWSYYDSALKEINKVAWTKILPNIKEYSPLAFATRSKGLTGVYEIYVNPNVPVYAQKPLQLHEMGHIIFSHMSLQKVQRDILVNKIMSYWTGLQKYLDLSAYTPEELKSISKSICNSILNIAMDYEVNSKLFTKDEWVTFKEYANWAHIQALAKSPVTDEDTLRDTLEKISSSNVDDHMIINPCWPEDANFPICLNYKQYIDLILLNQKDFFEQLKKALSNGGGQSKDGDGDGDSGDSQGGDGNGSKLSREDIDKLREQYNDTDSEANDSLRDAEIDEANNNIFGASGRGIKNKTGFTPVGSSKKTEVISIKNHRLLEKCLRNCIFSKSVTLTKSDSLYYYNRRKYNTDCLITRNVEQEVYVPGNVYILVDCSGSVGRDTLSALIGSVKTVAKECGQDSRIIWWNTSLVSDSPLKKCTDQVSSGGTNIAPGIKYINDKYLKHRDNNILVIISDYQDTLDLWYDNIKKLKCPSLGICWITGRRAEKCITARDVIKDFSYLYDGSDETVSKLFKILPTTFVNVD